MLYFLRLCCPLVLLLLIVQLELSHGFSATTTTTTTGSSPPPPAKTAGQAVVVPKRSGHEKGLATRRRQDQQHEQHEEPGQQQQLLPRSVRYYPGAFSVHETVRIVELFKSLHCARRDHRRDAAVRTNYYDEDPETVRGTNSPYRWIYERIVSYYHNQHREDERSPSAFDDDDSTSSRVVDEFSKQIEFVLLHEFDSDGYFDWHVDSLPNEGTDRTTNINVMLSSFDEDGDYEGGALHIGKCLLRPRRGDLYAYPPSFPHKVSPITAGRRHTLVIALRERPFDGEAYWKMTEDNFVDLCRDSNESKHHMLRGRFLHALDRPHEEIDEAFAAAYACTENGPGHAARFEMLAARENDAGNPSGAKNYANMAQLIRDQVRARTST